MSILDYIDNGTKCDDQRPYRASWLGETNYPNSDLGAAEESPRSAQSCQPLEDEGASQTSVADAQRTESESVDNLSETAQRFCVWGIDCGIVALFLIGIVIAAGDWGSTLLNTVAFFGGITLTIGTSAFAGWLHSKLGDVWE